MSEHTIICPSCNQLMSRSTLRCPNCGWNNSALNQLTSKIGTQNIGYLIIFTNLVVYSISLVLSFLFADVTWIEKLGFLSPNSSILNLMGWSDPYSTLKGSYWQLVSSMFLHAGVLHIAFNMIWLYHLYPQNDMIIGKQQNFIIYILSGIAGSLAATVFGSFPVVGASGAILGIMGALISVGQNSYNIRARMLAKNYTPVMIIILISGFIMPGISNLAHIGGGAFGYMAGWVIKKYQLNEEKLRFLTFFCAIVVILGLGFMAKNIISTLFL